MPAARDVLAYIQERMPELGITAAFKLLYYSQAWNLAWNGKPLFPERIEAWERGPVAARTWRETQGRVHGPPPKNLAEHDRHVVDSIIAFYGHHPVRDLVDMTHSEIPWADARRGLPEGASSNEEVTQHSMRRYFTRLAMRGGSMPRRPQRVVTPSDEDVRRIAAEEAPKWRTTLERLAE